MFLQSGSRPLTSKVLAITVVVTLLTLQNVSGGNVRGRRLSAPPYQRAAGSEDANITRLRRTFSNNITGESDKVPSWELGQDYACPERLAFQGNRWYNGIVPYTIDGSFRSNERGLIAQAFEDFARKTCIRFVPKTSKHRDYVDIQLDNSVCGRAHLCRQGGKQWAKIARKPECMNLHTVVHELGHTICMVHEHKRPDRDQFVQLTGNSDRNNHDYMKVDSDHTTLGLMYDYESVMHYECPYFFRAKSGIVKDCGKTQRLSVLDAEKINSLYNCGGCHSYRFRQPHQADAGIAYVGYDIDGKSLGVCRGYLNGDIVPGKYRFGGGACYIPWGDKEHALTNSFEVLTLPQSKYFSFETVKNRQIPSNAVAGGREMGGTPLYIGTCFVKFNGKNTRVPGKIHNGNTLETRYKALTYNVILSITYEIYCPFPAPML